MHRYAITLDKWTSPIFIDAKTVINAVKRAEKLFPVCDCGCREPANVTDVKQLK